MKNKLILLLTLVACFIPSIVAYTSYNQTQKAPVDEKTAVSISIDDINERNYTLTKESDGDEADTMIKYFLGVREHAQSIVALPDSLMGEKFFKVKISTSVKDETYEYYFTTDPATCYLRASDGSTYKIAESDAEMFITSEYAESLYGEASMPTLTLSHSYDIQPDSAVWQYKNYTGSFVDADTSDLIFDHVESYELEGGLDLTFDMTPDYCSVKITDEGENLLFDGTLADISTYSMSDTGHITVEVTARWYEDPARNFCGELNYKFSSLVTAPAEFYLGITEVEAGKFTAITALNVTKPENIRFSSTMGTDITPVFYKADESTAVGLLPISLDVPTGVYTITFVYGGTTQDTNITITNGGAKTSNVQLSETIIQTYRTEANLSAFSSTVEKITASGSSTRYFDGYFLQGIDSTATLLRGFGRDIYLNGSSTASYRNNGVDYRSAAGLDIVACNAGEVVYASADCLYAGNMIVIEHGYGLKTWYYNLGSINVSVGDIVSRGDKIGTTGQTGFSGEVGAHIAMSVGSTFVSPYDTWQDSSEYGKVIIAKIDE
ncbi:MAG: M23 family metallopeptidase [Eubacteriales bacterium]